MTPDLIRSAETRLKGVVRETPLLTSFALDRIAGRRVHVKAECLQHTGSFKFRGAWAAVSAMDEAARSAGILAFSSGNHAQGVALAAARHGISAVIVMPADAPAPKIENTRGFGAEVLLYDRKGGENREEIGAALVKERGLHLIRPYDDPDVISGQASVGLEIARQYNGGEADVLVCCGGGGLSAGTALALELDAPHLKLRTVEPEGFEDVARSLLSGRRERNTVLSGSVCDAILTPTPGELTFPILQRLAGSGMSVSDEECLRAVVLAAHHLRIILEPGGAAALAAALFRGNEIEGDDVVVVATGGNVDPSMLYAALKNYSN